jgi:hypothetical protein
MLRSTCVRMGNNEQFGVSDLADEAGISRSQIHRKLKSIKLYRYGKVQHTSLVCFHDCKISNIDSLILPPNKK